jgi:NADH-quinone oxidoreductase subunit C
MSDITALERLLREVSGLSGSHMDRDARGELYVRLSAESLIAVVTSLTAEGRLSHLSAITAEDDGERIHVLYHLWVGSGLTLDVVCPRENPSLPSLSDICPAALWYEREAHEMLGIHFVGHPDLAPLLLPDDWHEGPPLLKGPDA